MIVDDGEWVSERVFKNWNLIGKLLLRYPATAPSINSRRSRTREENYFLIDWVFFGMNDVVVLNLIPFFLWKSNFTLLQRCVCGHFISSLVVCYWLYKIISYHDDLCCVVLCTSTNYSIIEVTPSAFELYTTKQTPQV